MVSTGAEAENRTSTAAQPHNATNRNKTKPSALLVKHYRMTRWLNFVSPDVELDYLEGLVLVLLKYMPFVVLIISVIMTTQVYVIMQPQVDPWYLTLANCAHMSVAFIINPINAFILIAKPRGKLLVMLWSVVMYTVALCDIASDSFVAGYEARGFPPSLFLVASASMISALPVWHHIGLTAVASGCHLLGSALSPESVEVHHIIDANVKLPVFWLMCYVCEKNLRTQFQTKKLLTHVDAQLDSQMKAFEADGMLPSTVPGSVTPQTNSTPNADSDTSVDSRKAVTTTPSGGSSESKSQLSPSLTVSVLGSSVLEALSTAFDRARAINLLFADLQSRQSFFLATMSHELRAPLTAMLGCVRLLRSSLSKPKATVTPAEEVEDRTVQGNHNSNGGNGNNGTTSSNHSNSKSPHTHTNEICNDSPASDVESDEELTAMLYESGQHLLSVVNDILEFSRLTSTTTRFTLEPAVCWPRKLAQVCFDVGWYDYLRFIFFFLPSSTLLL